MTEVVINTRFGGFSLSHEATMEVAHRKGIKLWVEPSEIDQERGRGVEDAFMRYYFTVEPARYHALHDECQRNGEGFKRLNDTDWFYSDRDIPRDDPDLVAVVKKLRDRANGSHAQLAVVEVPDDAEWEIDEYDGLEHVAEKHRTWR